MKKTLLIAGIAAVAALFSSCNQNQGGSSAATAASDSTAVAGSIVFFNMDTVMQGYDMANDLTSVFETKTSGIQAEIDRRGKKLEKDAADFQNKVDKGLLTQSVAQVQYQKLQQQQQDYQQYVVRKQQEMSEEQQVMMNQIANAIQEFVNEYNAEKGYAMILATAGSILSTPVVTADPKLDITEDLLAGLNAAYIKTKESSK
ncbi:MAG: OmpH family outer membrane protein [Bacteroidales bacterium]|nr:OmpH family outer membrane protein [Bacteroidales bacterium]MBP5675995.1 OmpH family outer membrane protein [Bacteroidales bacterium]